MAEEIKGIEDLDEFCRFVNERPGWSARKIKSRELTPDEQAILKDWMDKHLLRL